MMEELPPELMVKVLAFTDIHTRTKLALCSLSLQQRVYRDCPQVWTNVDLSYSYNITDLGLSRFLTRINAKEVTKTLDLKYCRHLRGSGLMPIRNSRVLEHIDLRWTCAHTDPLPFLSILRLSIPYSLNHVELSTRSSGMKSDVTRDFMRCLREAKSIQADDQHVRCRSCQLPVVDALRQLVPNRFGPPVMKCLNCKGDFCRRVSCPMDVRECGDCGQSFCQDCKFRGEKCIFQCSDCKNNYCTKTCADRYECKKCKKESCSGCYGVLLCCCCESEFACRNCGTHSDLSQCDDDCVFCDDCWKTGRCDNCNDHVCRICERIPLCNRCGKKYCKKDDCKQQLEHCGVCVIPFCRDCNDSLEHCDRCNKSFCKSHDRFVDCAACDTRHCRACDHVERCKFCTRACFEDCSCTGRKPAKRARTS